jgi:hypothetical protein
MKIRRLVAFRYAIWYAVSVKMEQGGRRLERMPFPAGWRRPGLGLHDANKQQKHDKGNVYARNEKRRKSNLARQCCSNNARAAVE